jgi:hypothetical protein
LDITSVVLFLSGKPKDYWVTVGDHDYSESDEIEEHQSDVERIWKHPYFVFETLVNDIGLIKMQKPVNLNYSSIRPACMPDSDYQISEGLSAVLVGWGTDDPDQVRST